MNRRELMVLLSGAMTAPRVLCAQQKAMPVIGSLSAGSAEPAAPFVAAFGQGLGETVMSRDKTSRSSTAGRRATMTGSRIGR